MKKENTFTSGIRISMQYFADDGAYVSGKTDGTSGSDDANNSSSGSDNGTSPNQNSGADNGQSKAEGQDGNENGSITSQTIEKIVQAKVDRITADLGKKNADLQKQVDKLKREKMSDDEIKQLEMEEKEKSIADKEKALLDRENKLTAINALKEVGLDDGSKDALELVDFIIADDEENIKARATTLKKLIDKRVSAEVAKTFKQNGRTPNGGTQEQDAASKETSLAQKLGKAKAAQNKTADDVLKYYKGR